MDPEQLPEHIREKFNIARNGCWVWSAGFFRNGYGAASPYGGTRLAHRVVYQYLVGSIPDGLEIDHLCRNRACVNPTHLELVTHRENMRRAPSCGIYKTHCKHGHEFSEENTYLYASGKRKCRSCRNAGMRMFNAER